MVVAIAAAVTIQSGPTKPGASRVKPLKETKYFNIGAKSLDYKVTRSVKLRIRYHQTFHPKVQGKKDEHRFGVELKDNKQFHHTKTGSKTPVAINSILCFFIFIS